MKTIGLTERHGIADEYAKFPPKGFKYTFSSPKSHITNKLITSSAKGVFDYYDEGRVDLYEAPIFPILTRKNWIYTPADYSGTVNFTIFNCPVPRSLRLKAVEKIFEKDNFKKLIFKSHAGLETLYTYGNCSNSKIIDKACVVYPAIRTRPLKMNKYTSPVKNLLFSGDFFRKGGANVVDVFIELSIGYPNLFLTLCCDRSLSTSNSILRERYLKKIDSHPNIRIGKVSRKDMLESILPLTDIFISPTYQETFGFAILEAMSFGIPVISSNIFAIPEIIDSMSDGILIDIKEADFIKSLKGYRVNKLSDEFNCRLNDKLYNSIVLLINDNEMRKQLGLNAIKKCEAKFSPQIRADKMLNIYNSI